MKKILYVITSPSHKRVFESFCESNGLDQTIVGPKPMISSGLVPEDYRDFRIKNIKTYSNKQELQKIINTYNPDIYVGASLPIASGIKIPSKSKKVYVSHGMVGNHVIGLIKKAGLNISAWSGCDLYCGATKTFGEWIRKATGVSDNKILLNAIPQLDIIHDQRYICEYKDRVVAHTKCKSPNKIVLFAGFCCKDRYDFVNNNEDYFKTAIELERIARANNWLVMIKPRHTFSEMNKFLHSHSWGKKYISKYSEIQSSSNLHFITTTGHIYRYFFADAFVVNGTSTVEVEACAIGKPLVVVKTCPAETTDPHNTVSSGAAECINDLSDLEQLLTDCLSGKIDKTDYQKKYIIDSGISFDGNMYKRVQDKLLSVL